MLHLTGFDVAGRLPTRRLDVWRLAVNVRLARLRLLLAPGTSDQTGPDAGPDVKTPA